MPNVFLRRLVMLELTFTGGYLEDAQVLGYAYAFEQATLLRKVPPQGAAE